jgi:hypothetical protein
MMFSPQAIVDIYGDLEKEYASLRHGGVSASKSGYHSSVHYNRTNYPGDYSLRAPLDNKGDFDAARAIDLSLNTTEMIKGSKRLLAACKDDDPRLYGMREFIGTIDGKNVIAFNRYGDGHGGSRDQSGVLHGDIAGDGGHLWHVHLSIFTVYATSHLAMKALTSVLLGEPMDIKLTSTDIDKIADAVAGKLGKVWTSPDEWTPPPGLETAENPKWTPGGTLRYVANAVAKLSKT